MKEKKLRPLVLVGGGGHCRSVIEAAESAGREIKCVLDLPQYVGGDVSGYPIAASDDAIPEYVADCEFVVTLGATENPAPRRKLHQLVKEAGGRLATIVASTAFVSPRAEIGEGTVVLHHALVNANARVGESCIINSGALIEHDARVGDITHVSTGVRVNGACEVGSDCFIASGVTLAHGVKVCDGVMVGAGSVISKDLEVSGVYVGMPARKVR